MNDDVYVERVPPSDEWPYGRYLIHGPLSAQREYIDALVAKARRDGFTVEEK